MKKIHLNLNIWSLVLIVTIAVVLTAGVVYTVVSPQKITKEQYTFGYGPDKDRLVFEYIRGWHIYKDDKTMLMSDKPIMTWGIGPNAIPIKFRVTPNSVNKPKTLAQVVKDLGDSVVSSEDTIIAGLPAKKLVVFSDMTRANSVGYEFIYGKFIYSININNETPETQDFINSIRVK